MRILLLSQFYPPVIGGEERHVRNLGAALAQRGHEVCVGTLRRPGSPDVEMDGAVRVHRLSGTLQRLSGLHVDSERRHAPPFPDPELMLALKRLVASELHGDGELLLLKEGVLCSIELPSGEVLFRNE